MTSTLLFWTPVQFWDIKMDAEIGSYQADEPEPSPIDVSATPAAAVREAE
jgi:hypothetical protein